MKVTEECMPAKVRIECRVPHKSLVVRKKLGNLEKPFLLKEGTQQIPMCRNLRKPREN